MYTLKNVNKVLNEITIALANDKDLQKLLLVDQYNIDSVNFVPKSLQEMLDQHYICMTAQTEDSIKQMGRNTFLILNINYIDLSNFNQSTNIQGNIYIVTDINHALIYNHRNRALEIADLIIKDINDIKFTSSIKVGIDYINQIQYAPTLTGYQIKFNFVDQNNAEVEL